MGSKGLNPRPRGSGRGTRRIGERLPHSTIGCGLYLGAMSVLCMEIKWVVQWQMALRPAMAIASSYVHWTVFQVLTKGHIMHPKQTQSPDCVKGVTSDLVCTSSHDVTCD
jgi:hypothetical protein